MESFQKQQAGRALQRHCFCHGDLSSWRVPLCPGGSRCCLQPHGGLPASPSCQAPTTTLHFRDTGFLTAKVSLGETSLCLQLIPSARSKCFYPWVGSPRWLCRVAVSLAPNSRPWRTHSAVLQTAVACKMVLMPCQAAPGTMLRAHCHTLGGKRLAQIAPMSL